MPGPSVSTTRSQGRAKPRPTDAPFPPSWRRGKKIIEGTDLKVLILHDGVDAVAQAVFDLLAARNGSDFAVSVTMAELLRAKRWSHESACSKSRNLLTLENDRVIDLNHVVTFNRLPFATAFQFMRSSPEDRQYAFCETQALLLCWLSSLPGPVVNSCDHFGLAGPQFDHFSWLALAHRAGISTKQLSLTSSLRRFPRPHLRPAEGYVLGRFHGELREPSSVEPASLFSIGGQVFGDPDDLHPAVAKLARLADAEILEIRLSRTTGQERWVFEGADAVPRTLPGATLHALVALLERKLGQLL